MLRGITARQFQEWRHYADLEPFDEERSDARAASIVMAILNTAPRRKGSKLAELDACMLKFGKPMAAPALTTQEEASKRAEEIKRTMGAMINGQKRRKG
jgi:hypothetical protein